MDRDENRLPERARDPEQASKPVERNQVERIEIRKVIERFVRLLGEKEVVDLRHERNEPLPPSELAREATRDRGLAVLAEVSVRRLHEIRDRKGRDAHAELAQKLLVVVVVHLRPRNDEHGRVRVAVLRRPTKRFGVAAERRPLLEELDVEAGSMKRPSRSRPGDAAADNPNLLRHEYPLGRASSALGHEIYHRSVSQGMTQTLVDAQ